MNINSEEDTFTRCGVTGNLLVSTCFSDFLAVHPCTPFEGEVPWSTAPPCVAPWILRPFPAPFPWCPHSGSPGRVFVSRCVRPCRPSLAALRTLCHKARPLLQARCDPWVAAPPCRAPRPSPPAAAGTARGPARAARPLPALRGLPAHRLLPSQTGTAEAKRRAGGCLRLPPFSSDALCRVIITVRGCAPPAPPPPAPPRCAARWPRSPPGRAGRRPGVRDPRGPEPARPAPRSIAPQHCPAPSPRSSPRSVAPLPAAALPRRARPAAGRALPWGSQTAGGTRGCGLLQTKQSGAAASCGGRRAGRGSACACVRVPVPVCACLCVCVKGGWSWQLASYHQN